MKYLWAFFVIFTLNSCLGDDTMDYDMIDYDAQNETEILNYIEKHNLNAQKSESGLYYVINEEGTGGQPQSNSDVRVRYKGAFINGYIFDESDIDGITFNLQQVIAGWTEGITYFKEGGEGKLLIPSRLGYGYQNYNSIPAGSVLIFDIALLETY